MTAKRICCALLAVLLLSGNLSGCKQKTPDETIALTVGDHQITAVELNYYYVEMIDGFYRDYSYIISTMLDLSKPLSQQTFDEKTGQSWADYFLQCSLDNIRSTYALSDAAEAAGFALTQSQLESAEQVIAALEEYAASAGMEVNACLEELFGTGASVDTYRSYYHRNLLANSYYSHYYASLTYGSDALRAFEGDTAYRYNSYTYAVYYLPVSKFQTGDADQAAAQAACLAAAESISAERYADVSAFNAAISGLEVFSGQSAVTATEYTDALHTSITTNYTDWLSQPERTVGEVGIIPYTSGSGDDTVTAGYYLLFFGGKNDNCFQLKNVRHIYVMPDGGTYNSLTGMYSYSVREMAAAKVEADAILEEWNALKRHTEFIFGGLADKTSDDGDGTTGGLCENVYPGLISDSFSDWCYDETRKAGDVEIVESELGYHILFFIGDSALTYRDFLITADLRKQDTAAWLDDLLLDCTLTELDLSFVDLDRPLYTGI